MTPSSRALVAPVIAGLVLVLGTGAADSDAARSAFPAMPKIYHDGWIDLDKNGRKDVYEDRNASVDARVEDLLARMTADEKTAQMATLYGYGRVLKDPLPTRQWKRALWKDGIGNIDEMHNGYGDGKGSVYATDTRKHVWAMNEVQRFFVEQTRLGIPADFTDEGIRGVEAHGATSFPTQLGIGHTWNKALVRKIGRITALEGRAMGYTNIYAPILDVARDQRWGRMEEVYGEDPYLVSRLGVEMVKGMQQDFTVAATAKHFVVYSANRGAREFMARTDPQVAPREVEDVHVTPFAAAIREAGLLGVMSSYNDYDGVPVSGSHYWLTERLRNDLGFRGYVVSDSEAVEYLHTKHAVAADAQDAVRQAVEAGLNIRTNFTPPEDFVLPLRAALRDGSLKMSVVDDRVRDILRVKFTTGLFDRPYVEDAEATVRLLDSPEHRAVALQAARESLVLLKNAGDALPLRKDLKTVAVIGPNADDGRYSRRHYGPSGGHAITVLEGVRRKLGNAAEVRYAKGVEVAGGNWPRIETLPEPLSAEERAGIDEAVRAATGADVAVVVLGDGDRTTGESLSRTSLDLPGRQLELLQAVQATGTPVVLVLINGRPMSINWADAHVPAILEAWFPGDQGGTAIADALFGDYNPGGKLTVTFPKTAGQIPFNFPSKPNAQSELEKSRSNGALYYFGHGLSYTKFDYGGLRIAPLKQKADGKVTVSVDVRNTGDRAGDEVVQLYTRDLVSSVTTYEQNLRGFERIHLAPGETRTVSFTLAPADLALLNREMKRVVEPGKFRVMVGGGSQDIRQQAEFEIVQ
ncbi:glycoside hydrolase family 3 C-terminal domain-containing protein [Pseudoxanthomonas helianthi]|uniref:Beta-D-glucoside glucohydrolase n=1 Tax=Pseudoxanthomonas helianthi TaxID=1453541 RepID=A0A941AUS1_9GAMM|nr:glycoside hydrolase family 3 N-terminal domain-containing protein [Pseudoxanthomonas helianthi]MBP3983523.1 glycoside hydrolase family 3 C-terminal domain-containing protein [Pseudoxanthomonas helianthi]